jgi:pilus assembly protein Flp/PilA
MTTSLQRLLRDDEGQDLVEYALLLAFIAIVCILAITNLGQTVNGKYQSINSSLSASGS